MLWNSRERWGAGIALVAVLAAAPWSGAAPSRAPLPATQDEDDELEALLAGVRDEADAARRRGDWRAAERELDTLVLEAAEEGEVDWRSLAVRARLYLDQGRFEEAEDDAARAVAARPEGPPERHLAAAHRVRLDLRAELGRTDDLEARLAEATAAGFATGVDAGVDRAAGELLIEAGRRAEGEARLAGAVRRSGELSEARESGPHAWLELVEGGRAARALGDLPGASTRMVRAATLSAREPLALAELAALYMEADGEVATAASAQRNPGPLLREARQRNPVSQPALLALVELYRLNWRRSHLESDALLDELLAARPTSIDGLLARAEGELLIGDRAGARASVAAAAELAPQRRLVRAYEASLAALAGAPDDAAPLLDALLDEDPADSTPHRVVGTHLVDLYRFREALGVLEVAVATDPDDWIAWTSLGRARANTGDVGGAREALAEAERAAGLRGDAVRNNLARVLRIVDERFVEHTDGELTFAWREEGADVLALYLVPFYADARRELSARYGYTTGPVRIEVFDVHDDFSVRSTGFQGFPALGVCFGPVVTAVSPLSDLMGMFSWARTGYHEFTHVVHLGLSNNKCPRWVTEGLATWEEVRKNPSWTRNMRRELIDARANGTIFPVRDLNGAFRGPRVIFGYYQGGLLCDMLIARYGFESMLDLLGAFDRGADLDTALGEVFGRTPEELDAEFAEHVDAKLARVAIEPLWDAGRLEARWLTLPREAPVESDAAERWREAWLDLGFAAWQSDRRPDAEEALRIVGALRDTDGVPPRALFLRAQFALSGGDVALGGDLLEQFFASGGEDFRARLAAAELARGRGDDEAARDHLSAAERAFPGHPDPSLAAELALATLLDEAGETDAAMRARERWIAYNADDVSTRLDLARWHQRAGRHAEAARLFGEANDVLPFDRRLHLDWGASLVELGAFEEALREATAWEFVEGWMAARRAEAESDAAAAGLESAPTDAERGAVEALRARALHGLGRIEAARAAAERARALAPRDPRVRALEALDLEAGSESDGADAGDAGAER